MKKYTKYFFLLVTCLLASACSEELGLDYIKVVPGQEIQFGGNAYFTSGDPQTRTEYGKVVKIGTDEETGEPIYGIEVKWLDGADKVDIACPEAVGAKRAEYKVASVNNTTSASDNYASIANALHKTGDVGLQWSTSPVHNFYAAYPSRQQGLANLKTILSATEYAKVEADFGLNYEKKEFKGFIPSEQHVIRKEEVTEGETKGYILHPDMTNAYMIAKKAHTGENGNVDLQFNSIVTALQFQIKANDVKVLEQDKPIKIISVALEQTQGKQLCGEFTYNYETGEYTYPTSLTGSDKLVTAVFDPVILNKGDYLDVTFFLLPGAEFNSEENAADEPELDLIVRYTLADNDGEENPGMKSALMSKNIKPSKKYYISNVQLPVINLNATGTTWWSALPPRALFSQVSLPVAGNVFATTAYNGTTTHVEASNAQQVLTYEQLWDAGVRGFELVTDRENSTDGTATIGNQPFVCAEEKLNIVYKNGEKDVNVNFNVAFNTLANRLKNSPTETLLLLCTYMPCSGTDFNPQEYVNQLLRYFKNFATSNPLGFTEKDFIAITDATRVHDMTGKICIIIRPADDGRYEATGSYTAGINLNTWSGHAVLIQDWGTAFDVWDRRYGTGWARESSLKTNYAGGKALYRSCDEIENYLYCTSQSTTDINKNQKNSANFNNAPDKLPKFDENTYKFNYTHDMTGSTAKAFVQEWARVSPIDDDLNTNAIYTGYTPSSKLGDGELWVRWPASIEEKKFAIKKLFETSVTTSGDNTKKDLYINSLSGYYIDWDNTLNYDKSTLPFKKSYKIKGWFSDIEYDSALDVTGQGKGGNFKLLAYDLNKYVYDLISKKEIASGPLGLVIMDHIGNNAVKQIGPGTSEQTVTDDKSLDLVDLIMRNNFKYSLGKGAEIEEP